MSVSKTAQSKSSNLATVDAAHDEWMALRHPFFAGTPERLARASMISTDFTLSNKKRMRISGSTREALYYISKSDGVYQPVLIGFLRSIDSLLKRGIIEAKVNGWALTELGKMVVESFKGSDIFPKG